MEASDLLGKAVQVPFPFWPSGCCKAAGLVIPTDYLHVLAGWRPKATVSRLISALPKVCKSLHSMEPGVAECLANKQVVFVIQRKAPCIHLQATLRNEMRRRRISNRMPALGVNVP